MTEVILNAASLTLANNKSIQNEALPNGGTSSRRSLTAPRAKNQMATAKPDRCWNKAALACAATLLTAATHSNSGFFFVAFMRLFEANRETAAWPTSIFQAADESTGFIGMGLQKFFAVSTIALIGSVLFSAGILLSVLSPNLTYMTVTFGAIQGAGSGIVSFTTTLLVMMYFDRYRGIAIGIRYAGYSLSSLIFSPVLASLEDAFSFNQVLLLFAGISLHLTPLVLALKEPPWISKSAKPEKRAAGATSRRGSNFCKAGHCCGIENTNDHKNPAIDAGFQKIGGVTCGHQNNNIETRDVPNFICLTGGKSAKTAADNLKVAKIELLTPPTESKIVETNEGLNLTALNMSGSDTILPDCRLECGTEEKVHAEAHGFMQRRKNASNGNLGGDPNSKLIIWAAHENDTPGNTLDKEVPIYLRQPAALQGYGNEAVTAKSLVVAPNEHTEERACRCDRACSRKSNAQLDGTAERFSARTYVLSPVFWLFVLGGVLADYSDSAILSTIVDSALDRGATRLQADMAITCSAPSQLIGRTVLPLIADLGLINRTTMTCASYFLFAASVATLSATRTFSTYVAAAAFVSISTGSIMTMKHVVAADYFGVDAVAATWVACGTFITPLFFCSPSILGFFRDRLGSYDQFYYTLASVHALVGILFFFLVCHIKRGRKSWNLKQ